MRRSRKKKSNRGVWLLLIAVLVFGVVLVKGAWGNQEGRAQPSKLYSHNALVLRGAMEVYAKGGDEKIYPASLTKIMTAFVALENMDPEKRVTVPQEIFNDIFGKNASIAGLSPGEQVTVNDLVYGALLPSGADSAEALAVETAGSVEAFVDMMNEEAKALGMHDTHFTNTTGLHDSDHYTTVRDLGRLLRAALNNETFRNAFTSEKHVTGPTNKNPNGLEFYSTLFTKEEAGQFSKRQLLGGKTGYTPEAGLCLASLVKKNGKEYMIISTGAKGDGTTAQYNILDAYELYQTVI